MSGTYDADGQDDPKDYREMRHAMTVCGISPEDQHNLLSITAGILHLGNITFTENNNNAQIQNNASASTFVVFRPNLAKFGHFLRHSNHEMRLFPPFFATFPPF